MLQVQPAVKPIVLATPLQPIPTITAGKQALRAPILTVSGTRQRHTRTIMDKASARHRVTQTPLATPQHNRIATIPTPVYGRGDGKRLSA